MFEIPSRDDIKKVVISAEAVRGESAPRILTTDGQVLDLSDKVNPAA
jgi:ATP-dependent Clp protease ATP-binding subunit ClpX